MPSLTVTGFIDQFMDADKALEALGIISTETGMAGEAIAIDQPFYQDTVDNLWYKTSASTLEASEGRIGLAISAAAASGDIITGQFLGLHYTTGIIGAGTFYLATGFGELTLTPPTGIGQVLRSFAYSTNTSGIFVWPDTTYIEIGAISIPVHATSHTDGTDDIQLATAAQKGLMSSVYANKLDNTETGARVLSFNNQTGAIAGAETGYHVSSFNGATGIIVGAETGTHVSSLNGQTGVLVLDGNNISGIYGGVIKPASDYVVASLISGAIIEMDAGTVYITGGLNGTISKFRFDVFQTGTGTVYITGGTGVSINNTVQGGAVLGGQYFGASVYLSAAESYMVAGGA